MKRKIIPLLVLALMVAGLCVLTAARQQTAHTEQHNTSTPPTEQPDPLTAMSPQAHPHINVVILGDSQTWIGGDNCDKPRGWNKWFCDRFSPKSCKSYARSGATWTNTPQTVANTKENVGVLGDNNVIYNQVQRLKEALADGRQAVPQLIIVYAGANDAWFGSKRPHRFDKRADEVNLGSTGTLTTLPPAQILTLAEAVCHNCLLLRQLCPEAQIVMLTPMQMTKVPTDVVRRVGDIIADCGQRLDINVIRLDKHGSVNAMQEKKAFSMTTDGVHTSERGAQKNGYYVAEQIQQMLQHNHTAQTPNKK